MRTTICRMLGLGAVSITLAVAVATSTPSGEARVGTVQSRVAFVRGNALYLADVAGGRQVMVGVPGPLDISGVGWAWSRDGRLAFGVGRTLYVAGADGRNRRRIALVPRGVVRHPTASDGRDWAVDWSPSGRWIAFATMGSVYVVAADGSRRWTIARDVGRTATFRGITDVYYSTAWSPDSSRLLVNAQVAGSGAENAANFVVSRIGGKRWYPSGTFFLVFPGRWSPDGRKIAFSASRLFKHGSHGNPDSVYAAAAEGGKARAVGHQEDPEADIEWSPDGTSIYAAASVGGPLLMLDALKGGTRRIAHKLEKVYDIVVSPDRRRVAIQGGLGDGKGWEIFVMHPDGTRLRRLTYNRRNDGDPKWSPDGTRIAFTSTKGDGSDGEVYVVKAAGGRPTNITHSSAEESLSSWVRNGK